MKAFKLKAESGVNEAGGLVLFPNQPKSGSFRLQAVFYSSENPTQNLYLYDAEGDMVTFPIPGQLDKKVIPLDPVTVKLPLYYIDEAAPGNQIIVFGETE